MRKLVTLIAAALIALLATAAFAGTATVTWSAPTQNTDGSAIAGAISYKVYGAVQGATKVQVGTAAGLTFTHTAATNGSTYCYDVTATVAGVESAHSLEACKAIPASVPNPPGGVIVTVPTAYNLIKFFGRTYAYKVGTVPVGTSCGAAKGSGFYDVAAAAVTLKVRPLSQSFVAKCA